VFAFEQEFLSVTLSSILDKHILQYSTMRVSFLITLVVTTQAFAPAFVNRQTTELYGVKNPPPNDLTPFKALVSIGSYTVAIAIAIAAGVVLLLCFGDC